MSRRSLKDRVWLQVALDISKFGTCARRQVGAVFLDDKGRVIATGFNGVAPDVEHCTDHPCAGASCAPGTGLELCEAIHAEQNALAQCQNIDAVHTVYSTDSPCMHCVKMLAVTGAKRIVFGREYPHPAAKAYWLKHGGAWEHIPQTGFKPVGPPNQQDPIPPINWVNVTFFTVGFLFAALTVVTIVNKLLQ